MSNLYVNDFNTTVQTYYKELKRFKPLSREREVDLFKKAKSFDMNARKEIMESNLKFVFDIAKRYKGRGVAIEDLISEGNIGLARAFDKFDETRNIRFISYAVWWIRQAMQECISKRGNIDNCEKYEEESIDFNVSRSNVSECSFDEEDEHITKNETICSDEKEQEKRENDATNKKVIEKLITKLSPRSKYIVTSYYGLDGKKEMTLEEIGNELSLSKERVRQIKLSALKLMRSEILLTDYSDLSF